MQVTGLGAVIIGYLGNTRLPVITERYLKEVEIRLAVDLNSARQEIVQLTEGMKQLRLPTETSAQVSLLPIQGEDAYIGQHQISSFSEFVSHAQPWLCIEACLLLLRMFI